MGLNIYFKHIQLLIILNIPVLIHLATLIFTMETAQVPEFLGDPAGAPVFSAAEQTCYCSDKELSESNRSICFYLQRLKIEAYLKRLRFF